MKDSALRTDDTWHAPCALAIPNQLSALREMSAWLDAKLRRLGMAEELIFNFDLCANEAVTNIVSYAYPECGVHEILLRLSLQDATVTLEIEDDGMPFDPLARPPHVQPESLEQAAIGGLGIDLIRSIMDECHYARQHDRNILKLIAHFGDRQGDVL